jgi:PTS system galactitol-specific IIA component
MKNWWKSGWEAPITRKSSALLSGKVDGCGYVEEGLPNAVLARERQYPTGLPTKIPVALCHVEAEFVKQTSWLWQR